MALHAGTPDAWPQPPPGSNPSFLIDIHVGGHADCPGRETGRIAFRRKIVAMRDCGAIVDGGKALPKAELGRVLLFRFMNIQKIQPLKVYIILRTAIWLTNARQT